MSDHTRNPYSREAEHAVLGAMMNRPEMIDSLSSDLLVGDFYFENNRAIYQAILALHSSGEGVDAVTVADKLDVLPDGDMALPLCGEIQKNTPSFVNAGTYAKIIHERAIDRQIIEAAKVVHEVAHSDEITESKIAKAQAAILGIDGQSATPETVLAVDVLRNHMDELERRHKLGGKMDGLPTGLDDLDRILNGLRGGQLVTIAGRPKAGKGQPLSSSVLLADGSFTTIGELKHGDELASVDGQRSIVTGIYPQGIKPVYRLTLNDGRTVEADDSHLWEIHCSKLKPQVRVVDTIQLKAMLEKVRYEGRITLAGHNGSFGEDKHLGIDPWLLGFLLGDGCFQPSCVSFTAAEDYILDRVKGACGVSVVHNSRYDYRLTDYTQPGNPITKAIRELGLIETRSHTKFIPNQFFSASREVRQALLAGLLESDGWVEKHGTVRFASSSKQLRDDVVRLVQSLGGYCYTGTKLNCGYKKDGMKVDCKDSYGAVIVMADMHEFIQSPRILKNLRVRKRRKAQPSIRSVECVRYEDTVCIKVSHPSELYLTDNYVVTHNTTLAVQIARHVALVENEQTLIISLEMGNAQLMDRILAAEGSVPLGLIKSGEALNEYGDNLFLAANKISQSQTLQMSDRRSLTMSRCRSMGRRHKMIHGLKLMIIDHIGLLDPEKADMNETAKITEITRQAKLMAEELDCVVILVSQLNRELEKRPNKRPVPSDLRNSGSIEQDSDLVIFVYRDEVYHPDTPHKGIAEIIVGAARDCEPGTAYAGWQGQYNRFVNLEAGYRPVDDDNHGPGPARSKSKALEEF